MWVVEYPSSMVFLSLKKLMRLVNFFFIFKEKKYLTRFQLLVRVLCLFELHVQNSLACSVILVANDVIIISISS